MKKAIVVGIVLAVGIAIGITLRHAYKRYPISGGYFVTHYCLCVEEQPLFQAQILDAAADVNKQIEERTKEFARRHKIEKNDLRARFIPLRNGNYEMVFWCSNRTAQIGQLDEAFREMIKTCLEPHSTVLGEAHKAYQKQYNQGAQQGAEVKRGQRRQ